MTPPRPRAAAQLLLVLLTCTAAYLTFRFLFNASDSFPFSQELLLVFIGAVATVLITAALINRQTELELRKEGQVLLLDRKSGVYFALIEHLGEIVEKGRLEEEALAELRVLNHKLAMVADGDVIRHFGEVLNRLERAVRDGDISDDEQDRIMRAAAELTWWMRRDLLGRFVDEDPEAVLRAIRANNAGLESAGG